MAEGLGSAVLELRTDDKNYIAGLGRAERGAERLDRGLQSVERRAETLGRRLDSAGARLQSFGTRLTLAFTLPAAAIAASSVKTASDIQELNNLVDVTFGESADSVRAWSEQMARAMGRASAEMLRAAGDFAAFLKPLGVAPELIVPMSEGLTRLVTDISSFRNLAEGDVFTALFSGLAGETEAVRRLGIDLGQAALEQELLNLGVTGGTEAASQAQKTLARYNLIVAQTRDAQGDAARTAGSFENRSRALGATLHDVRAEIGEKLLPLALALTNRAIELGQAFLSLSDGTQMAIISVAGFIAIAGPFFLTLGLMSRGLAVFVAAFVASARGIRLVVRAIIAEMALLAAALASPVAAAVAASVAILAAWALFKNTILATGQAVIDGLEFILVQGFRNTVERPFIQAINDLVEALPALLRERLGIEPLELPPEILGNPGEVFAAGFEKARMAAQEEVAAIEAALDGLVDSVKSVLPDGLADTLLGDFDGAGAEIDAATAKLDKLMASLDGAGTVDAKTAKKQRSALQDAQRMIEALEAETAALAQGRAALEEYQAVGARVSAFRQTLEDAKLAGDEIERLTARYQFLLEARRGVEQGNAIDDELAGLAREREVLEARLAGEEELAAVIARRGALEDRLGRSLTPQELSGLSQEIGLNRQLNAELQARDGLVQALESSLDRGLNAAIDGNIKSWKDLGRVAIDVLRDILKSVINLISVQSGGGGGGIGSMILSGIGSIFGGAGSWFGGGGGGGGLGSLGFVGSEVVGFAGGGRPPLGQASIVGERGPEWFVPDQPGTILPNEVTRAMGAVLNGAESSSRSGGQFFIDARGADRSGLARLEATIRSLDGSIEPRAVAAVAGARQRDPRLFGGRD